MPSTQNRQEAQNGVSPLIESTRDWLAHASRATDPNPSAARFVGWVIGAATVVCVALLAALWWIDPISATGRLTRFSVVENGGVRQAKLDLMEQLDAAPDVLLLGSSRSMMLDPDDVVEISGRSAFNGAVSGGTIRDSYLYAKYAEQLWGRDQFPHLVIGVVNDVLRNYGTATQDPRLKQLVPARENSQPNIVETSGQLLQWSTLKAASVSVPRIVERYGAQALLEPTDINRSDRAMFAVTGRQKANQQDQLLPNGMRAKPDRIDPSRLEDTTREHMREFVQRSYIADAQYKGTSPRGELMLRRTIQLANRNGDVPTLWVTPFQPFALTLLPEEHADRDRAFRRTIAKLQGDPALKFRFIDFANISEFDGIETGFTDGFHLTRENTARIIAELERRGALSRSEKADRESADAQ